MIDVSIFFLGEHKSVYKLKSRLVPQRKMLNEVASETNTCMKKMYIHITGGTSVGKPWRR